MRYKLGIFDAETGLAIQGPSGEPVCFEADCIIYAAHDQADTWAGLVCDTSAGGILGTVSRLTETLVGASVGSTDGAESLRTAIAGLLTSAAAKIDSNVLPPDLGARYARLYDDLRAADALGGSDD